MYVCMYLKLMYMYVCMYVCIQVGLDSEINELVEGSDLYEPAVNLSQVILPKGAISIYIHTYILTHTSNDM